KALSDAIWLLAGSTAIGDVLQNLPVILARANATVNGTGGEWEVHLANTYNNWITTEFNAGTDDQFERARDQLVRAGWQFAAEIKAWVELNDLANFTAQGRVALHRLARTSDAAYQYLMLGPGSEAYDLAHPSSEDDESDEAETASADVDDEDYTDEVDE